MLPEVTREQGGGGLDCMQQLLGIDGVPCKLLPLPCSAPPPPRPCSVRRKAVEQRNPTLYTMEPRLTSTKPPQHILDKVHLCTALTTPHHHLTYILYLTAHHTTLLTYVTPHHLTPHHLTPHYITPHPTSHHNPSCAAIPPSPHHTTYTSPFPFQIQENKINIEIHTTSTLQVKHYCVDSESCVTSPDITWHHLP